MRRTPTAIFLLPAAENRRLLASTLLVATLFAVLASALVPSALFGQEPSEWQRGIEAFQAQDWSRAGHHFQAVIDRQPAFSGAHLMLGRSMLALGQRTGALEALERAGETAESDRQRAEASFLIADLHLGSDQPAAAVEALGGFDPEALSSAHQETLLRLRSVARLRSGDAAAGLADLRAGVALTPNDPKLLGFHSRMELAYGEPEAAVAAFEALHALDARLGMEPGFEDHLLLAEARLAAGRPAAALPSLEAAAALDPEAWKPPCYQGQVILSLERWADAREPLEACLQRAPEEQQAPTWRLLGLSFEKERLFPESRAAYLAAGDLEAVARVDHNQQVLLEELAEDKRRRALAEIARQERKARDAACRLQGKPEGCLEADTGDPETRPAQR